MMPTDRTTMLADRTTMSTDHAIIPTNHVIILTDHAIILTDHFSHSHCSYDHCPYDHCPYDHCPYDYCSYDHCPYDHCSYNHCLLGLVDCMVHGLIDFCVNLNFSLFEFVGWCGSSTTVGFSECLGYNLWIKLINWNCFHCSKFHAAIRVYNCESTAN